MNFVPADNFDMINENDILNIVIKQKMKVD